MSAAHAHQVPSSQTLLMKTVEIVRLSVERMNVCRLFVLNTTTLYVSLVKITATKPLTCSRLVLVTVTLDLSCRAIFVRSVLWVRVAVQIIIIQFCVRLARATHFRQRGGL